MTCTSIATQETASIDSSQDQYLPIPNALQCKLFIYLYSIDTESL